MTINQRSLRPILDRGLLRPATLLCIMAAGTGHLVAQCPEIQRIKTDQGHGSISADGNLAVFGAVLGGPALTGTAAVFRLTGTSWVQQQELTASDGNPFDEFGCSVAVEGNVIVVGAQNEERAGNHYGAAYVFRFNGTQWVEEQKLVASDGRPDDEFGDSVAVRGSVIAVGAHRDNSPAGADHGSVYVFRFDGAQWVEEQKLIASDAATGDRLGAAIAMRDDSLIIAGAPRDDTAAGGDAGSVYVFRFDGTHWLEDQKLEGSEVSADDRFGTAVSVHGDLLAVGASHENRARPGSAYVFRRNASQYVEEQRLVADDGAAYDLFGCSVAVRGDLVLVGTQGDNAGVGIQYPRQQQASWDDDSTGAAYLYRFAGPSCGWIQDIKKTAGVSTSGDQLGYAVALSNQHALVGLWGVDAACVFDTAELVLDVDPILAHAGQTITFVTSCGIPNQPVALVVTNINGGPTFSTVMTRDFDADFQWTIAATVPPGLTGMTVTFQTFKASDACRYLALGSNEVIVSFQ